MHISSKAWHSTCSSTTSVPVCAERTARLLCLAYSRASSAAARVLEYMVSNCLRTSQREGDPLDLLQQRRMLSQHATVLYVNYTQWGRLYDHVNDQMEAQNDQCSWSTTIPRKHPPVHSRYLCCIQWRGEFSDIMKHKSLCKPGITHSSRLHQGVVGPVAVPSSLEKKRGLT